MMPQRAIKILSRTCLSISFSNDVDAIDEINAENASGNDDQHCWVQLCFENTRKVAVRQLTAVNRGTHTLVAIQPTPRVSIADTSQ